MEQQQAGQAQQKDMTTWIAPTGPNTTQPSAMITGEDVFQIFTISTCPYEESVHYWRSKEPLCEGEPPSGGQGEPQQRSEFVF